ncbi:MAG: hypothetical protein ACFFD4_05680 [Candidatus Odinarchaeota archaeon]
MDGQYIDGPLYSPSLMDLEPYVALITNCIIALSACAMIFLGTLHAIRSREEKTSVLIWSGNFFFLIINITAVVPLYLLSIFYRSILGTPVYQMLISTLDIWRLGFTILLLYSYLTVKPVIDYGPTKKAILLWTIASIALTALAIIRLFFRINYISSGYLGDYFVLYGDLLDDLNYVTTFIAVIILFIITTWYPESLLISEAQVLRACKIYAIVKTYPPVNQPDHWGLASIKNYLESIPESIWKEGCD